MNRKISIVLFSLLVGANFLFAQKSVIERVEPPFWWTGMKDNSLQLLVYGKSIGSSTVSIKSDIVLFESAQQVENKNYLFVNLLVKKDAKAGFVPIEFTLNGKTFTHTYELKQRRKDAAIKPVVDGGDVVYLITPDRFANGDPSNDNIDGFADKLDRKAEYGRHGGDIQGIIDNVDYLKDLGVTAVWPNPLLENNQKSSSYHGYAISNFYETDKRFGDNALYKKLAEKLHENGLKLFMDQVLNHCGSGYWWMNDLPMKDWINSPEEFGRSNFNNIMSSDPYASQTEKNKHYRGYFDTSMPDLNHANPFMSKYTIQNSVWWIEYLNLDGLRIDTYPYVDKYFSAVWRKHIENEYPGMFVVGEVWVGDVAYEAYWNSVGRNADGYESNLNSITDFPLYYAVLKAFDKGGNVSELYNCLSKDFLYGNPELNLTHIDNHDINRIFGDLKEDLDKYKLAATFLFTTRGIPQWYYGSEILMKAKGSHGYIREDMPGGWTGDKRNVFKGENMTVQEMEALNFIKKLLAWRKTSKAIKDGKLVHYSPNDNIYVYFRMAGAEKLMIVINNGNGKKELDLDRFEEVLAGHTTGKEVLTKESFDLSKPMPLKSNAAYIISVE